MAFLQISEYSRAFRAMDKEHRSLYLKHMRRAGTVAIGSATTLAAGMVLDNQYVATLGLLSTLLSIGYAGLAHYFITDRSAAIKATARK
ncbi:MAG TPA: hypothetical protein VL945_00190 [Candidatus Saccharimonadales bacterium]|nr:hypothetical protein [Candidatus Saccharimonadales bacterium]